MNKDEENIIKFSDTEYMALPDFASQKGIEPDKVINMVRDGFYQGRLIEGLWYVAIKEIEPQSNFHTAKEKPVKRLMHGEYGLAKTFWFSFVVMYLFMFFCIGLLHSQAPEGVLKVALIINYILKVILLISIWRSASQYGGRSVWRIGAKFYVFVELVMVLINAFAFFHL